MPSIVPAGVPSSAGVWQKFALLSWKNFLLQKRHKLHTLIDILLPVLSFLLLAYLQKLSRPEIHPQPTIFSPLSIDTLEIPDGYQPSEVHKLVFYPNNTIFQSLINDVSQKLRLESPVGVNDINELELTVKNDNLIAGVQFHHSSVTTTIPKDLSYSLRFPAELRTTDQPSYTDPTKLNWLTNKLFPADLYNEPRNINSNDGGFPSYYKEGFLAIQNAIARAFVTINGNQMPSVQVKRFPYPPYSTDVQLHFLQYIAPLFVLICFNYTFSNTVRFVAVEKEKQLKESMKIMGLPNWLHWLSWFVRTMVMLTISVVLIIILLKIPMFGATNAVFPHSNSFLLGLFFVVFCICLTTFSFLLSVFFSKAKSAVTAATIAWYLSYVPFMITHARYDELAGYLKVILCIFPNTAMGYGIKLIVRNEEMGNGLNWSTLWSTVNIYDNLTVGITMCFLLLSSLIFILLTLYVESIYPGSYGVAKPWNFPFKKEFWCRSSSGRSNYESFDNSHDNGNSCRRTSVDPGSFEEEPQNEHAGVKIRNLCKIYANKNAAVCDLSMNMFDNQITILLGHNGAGKTTTLSMLTGMTELTSGTALINGYDIRKNTDLARSSMGFCPQHNILFDELTVREHLIFYSRLKGLNADEANYEVEKYVRLLELESKIDEMAQTLSGGMKRKLSIGIALCGQSKVVFCDEPTSGMDPAARRSLWNVLIEEKKNRVIVLTTHFMDEADVLGDRIGIMARGELKCFGSPFFLKKRFGTGYHLVCEKSGNCNSYEVTQLLRKYLPDIDIDAENESEIFYQLQDDQVHLFQEVFTDLEQNETKLNLKSYGVSLTTMEEIFLKFGKDSVQLGEVKVDETVRDIPQNNAYTPLTIEDHDLLLTGTSLLNNQAIAMFKKRCLCWLRSWKNFLYYNVVAIIILAPIAFQGSVFSEEFGLPSLDITLNAYKTPITVVQEINRLNNSFSEKIIHQYKENIKIHSPEAKVVMTVDDVDSYLLNVDSVRKLNFQYLTAIAAFANGTILAWFNNQFYHTAPLALNLVHNAIVRAINPDLSISVVNAPLKYVIPHNNSSHTVDDSPISIFGISTTISIGIIMSIISASYIMFYIKERECRAKFMQYVSGTNLCIFWISSILWDVLTSMITVVLIIIMLLFSRQDYWSSASTLAIIFLLLLLFNYAMMPIICLASLIFSKPTTGVNVLTFAGIIISFVFIAEVFLEFMNTVVRHVLLFYPTCALMESFVKLSKTEMNEQICDLSCHTSGCDRQRMCVESPECCPNRLFSWDENSVAKDLVYMILTNCGAMILLLSIEYGLLSRIVSYVLSLMPRKLPSVETDDQPLDDDVGAIKERINAMTVNELRAENLILQSVSKFYGSFLAVNQVSLEIKQAECFGLLGNNGAGKTSVFKMLTGEERISSGEAFLRGMNLKSDMPKIYKCVGYCPQFDALFDNLTARETLEIFALLRGVPRNEVASYAVRRATELDFIEYIDKQVSQLSGGNKRKLSTAIALVGNPLVILLDEPTTGMDPATKRNLWNIIINLREQGKSIVLTSHSMEECEALCTRLTIMVNGNFKCYGSSQHLKNKFTKGFEMKVKVKHQEESNSYVMEVKDYIAESFNGAVLNEEYNDLLTYTIPSGSLKWSTVFGLMENGKRTHHIDDYSVSQNSLEQVLITFVKNQRALHVQQ